jgi:hypothetical protein
MNQISFKLELIVIYMLDKLLKVRNYVCSVRMVLPVGKPLQ